MPCSRVSFALAAAAVAFLSVAAQAQRASFCGGKLAGDSLYSSVTSSGSKSRIDYFLQLRNTTSMKLAYSIQFVFNDPSVGPISERVNSQTQELNPFQSKTLKLASQTVNNPAGQGKIAHDVLVKNVHALCR